MRPSKSLTGMQRRRGDKSSGANKAQAVGEATEVNCVVRVKGRLRRGGGSDLNSCESGDVLVGALSGTRFGVPFRPHCECGEANRKS